MSSKKRGRPFNSKAREIVLKKIGENPGLNFHKLWRLVEESGMSKGLFNHILNELEKSGKILRKERERITKTVTFQLRNLNDLSSKSSSPRGETYLSLKNGESCKNG